MACNIPTPASLVALPPIPTKNLRQPRAIASMIISPVPSVEVAQGLRSSTVSSGKPLAAAISKIAVSPAIP